MAERHALLRYQSEYKNINIEINKYFISSSGDQTHIQSILQTHFVPLRHDWPYDLIFISINYQGTSVTVNATVVGSIPIRVYEIFHIFISILF